MNSRVLSLLLLVGLFTSSCKLTQRTPKKALTYCERLAEANKPVDEKSKSKKNKSSITTPAVTPMILIETSLGNIKVKLYDNTPLHRDNFLKLVCEAYFDGTIFHRVISGFMIQGGDPNSKNAPSNAQLGIGGPSYTIPAEFNDANVHLKGALCAARQGDQVNPKKASSGSQFYIVQGNALTDVQLDQMERQKGIKYTPEQREAYKTKGGTPFLDRDYTVFGEVVDGWDVIDKIAATQTDRRNGDRPVQDVTVKMSVINE